MQYSQKFMIYANNLLSLKRIAVFHKTAIPTSASKILR